MHEITTKDILYSERMSEAKIYLLLDINYYSNIQQDIYPLIIDNDWVPIFCNSPYKHLLDTSPLLIKVKPCNAQLIEDVMKRLSGIIVTSSCGLSTLQEILIDILTVESDDNREGTCFLRYFTPITATSLLKNYNSLFIEQLDTIAVPDYTRESWLLHDKLAVKSKPSPLITVQFKETIENERMAYYLGYFNRWKAVSKSSLSKVALSLNILLRTNDINNKTLKKWEYLLLSATDVIDHHYWFNLLEQDLAIEDKWNQACFLIDTIRHKKGLINEK
ncbi:DUF4123 domain-containing protein [Photobacterium sanguinicancri]|uniref:DUF4123 domain-containing protein n=1 Tax=Photobacterium sanguinicancri TaxID=875932 RepID=UPI003D0DEB64